MNPKDPEELRVLIDDVIYFSTKNDAKVPAKKLEFFVSQLKGQLPATSDQLACFLIFQRLLQF